MANRSFTNQQALEKGLVTITGSFLPNGSSALSAAGVKGTGFTVAYTSTGKYTVTLSDAYLFLYGVSLTLALNAADDKALQLGAVDVVTAKTIVINCWDTSAAALTDIASNANNRVYFTFLLKNSTV